MLGRLLILTKVNQKKLAIMKKQILLLVILASFSLVFVDGATAATTNPCFDLTITDNCSGEWTGYYTARVTISFGGNEYCSTTIYNLSAGPNSDLTYSCDDLPIEEASPCYVINVTVCRQQENPTCCGSNSSGLLTYAQLENCSVTSISVILH